MFVHAFDTLTIPVLRSGTWGTCKKVICLNNSHWIASSFSLVMPILHESEHTKLMIWLSLLITNFLLAVPCWQSLPWEGIEQSQGDPDSRASSSDYFPLLPPRPVSFALFFREDSSSIFLVHIGHASRSRPFAFECSLCQQHGPSAVLPSCACAGFISLILLRSILLELPCANPATSTPVAPDHGICVSWDSECTTPLPTSSRSSIRLSCLTIDPVMSRLGPSHGSCFCLKHRVAILTLEPGLRPQWKVAVYRNLTACMTSMDTRTTWRQ